MFIGSRTLEEGMKSGGGGFMFSAPTCRFIASPRLGPWTNEIRAGRIQMCREQGGYMVPKDSWHALSKRARTHVHSK